MQWCLQQDDSCKVVYTPKEGVSESDWNSLQFGKKPYAVEKGEEWYTDAEKFKKTGKYRFLKRNANKQTSTGCGPWKSGGCCYKPSSDCGYPWINSPDLRSDATTASHGGPQAHPAALPHRHRDQRPETMGFAEKAVGDLLRGARLSVEEIVAPDCELFG